MKNDAVQGGLRSEASHPDNQGFCIWGRLRNVSAHGLATGTSALALAAAVFIPLHAHAVDRYYTAAGDVVMNLFPSGGFDTLPVGAADRAVYNRAGTGASTLWTARTIGGALFTGDYTGTGFSSDSPNAALYGRLTVDGVNGIGIESHVNQTITLFNTMIVGSSQEWRIDSETGTVTQASNETAPGRRVLNLQTHTLTLNPVRAGNSFILNNPISGTGSLNIIGAGRVEITADSTAYTGPTIVSGGNLLVNASIVNSAVTVDGGRLGGTGTLGSTTNNAGGTIAPGNSIGILTVGGDYTSNGGRLEVEAELGADGSPADLLRITGDSILGTGPTRVSVVNVGGAGAQTTADGIRIVEVQGGRSDAGAFVLDGLAIGGIYRYDLHQHDLATGADGAWYLRSTGTLSPTVATIESYPISLLGMIDTPTLRQRMGLGAINEKGLVTRIEGSMGHYKTSSSLSRASYDSNKFLAQLGLNGRLVDNEHGSLNVGLFGFYNSQTATVYSPFGDGRNATQGFGIGASLTWSGTSGTYVDLQGQLSSFTSNLEAAGQTLVSGNRGKGWAIGIEAGRSISLNDRWALTPQAQLSYSSVSFDAFTDRFGTQVTLRNGASLKGRVGLGVDYQHGWKNARGQDTALGFHAVASLTQEFLDGATVQISGTNATLAGQKFGAELGIGGSYSWAGGARKLHGELVGSTSFQGSNSVKGTIGFTHRF